MKVSKKFVVDCSHSEGPLNAIWRSFGYDEINWTYTPRGKRVFQEIGKLSSEPYYIRCHHTFTSGNGLSTPTRGSGNVCHLGKEDGELRFDFGLLDQVYDTILQNNCKPIIEIGFMPDILSSGPQPRPTYDYRGSDLWMYPPRDYQRWRQLVYETVSHYASKYGKEEVATWYWEVWNEPDNPGFFKGSVKDYCRMYDFAVAGAVDALESVKIGGPGLARNPKFLKRFLKHCCRGKNQVTGRRGTRLDFISFHAKGTGWPLFGRPFEMPSLRLILSHLVNYAAVLERFPQYETTPLLFDECDMAVATNYGRYDFPEFEINNSEYYPIFVIRMAKNLMDFMARRNRSLKLFTTWAFYFEGKRFFEGNRALFTNRNIKNPILNAFTMLEKLGATRLRLTTNPASQTGSVHTAFPQIDGLASGHADGSVSIVVWNFSEDRLKTTKDSIELEIRNLSFASGKAKIERFQIDAEHSNSYAAWQRLGAPQDPSEEEISVIKKNENLELIDIQKELEIVDGVVKYELELPMPAVCLVKLGCGA